MILSNALLVLSLSGPDLVLVSGRQAGRVGSRFHCTRGCRAITRRVRYRRPLCRPRLATSSKIMKLRV